MRTRRTLALVLFALMLCPLSAHAGDKVEIISAEFGLFSLSDTGTLSFAPTTVVPLVTGQGYGWIIRVKTDLATVHWREEFTLPEAPTVWGGATGELRQSISPDKKVSVMEGDAVMKDGPIVFNSWSVAAGDPKGKYKIRVVIDNDIERVFEFDVVEPVPPEGAI